MFYRKLLALDFWNPGTVQACSFWAQHQYHISAEYSAGPRQPIVVRQKGERHEANFIGGELWEQGFEQKLCVVQTVFPRDFAVGSPLLTNDLAHPLQRNQAWKYTCQVPRMFGGGSLPKISHATHSIEAGFDRAFGFLFRFPVS